MIGIEGVPPRTGDMLDFLVVGGGITGLSCAWKLCQVGHRVTLLEQNDQLSKCGEVVHSVSASTRILDEWGISNLISEVAIHVEKIMFLDGLTAEEIGVINVSGKILDSLPADFKSIPYGELYRVFYNLAIQAGVLIRLRVKAVEVDPWTPMVTTSGGERLTADVIIGADGLGSVVRSVFPEPKPVLGIPLRYNMNLHVSPDLLRRDEELAKLVDSFCTRAWTGWLSDDCLFTISLAGSGPNSEYTITIYLPRLEKGESWSQFPLSDELLNLFEPRVQKILKLAEFDYRILFVDHQPFDIWVHESGKVVLMGQAAHPIVPNGLWDVATCIEDALTLSTLFSLPATRSQTAMLLGVFEELRQSRCATIQSYSCRKRATITMPRGRQQEVRDGILRDQLARDTCDGMMSEDDLSFYYSGLLQLFGFDAREAIQDWWVTFGRNMLLRGPEPELEPELRVEEGIRGLEPMLVAAEVEGEVLPARVVSDVLMGEYIGVVSGDACCASGMDV